MSQPPQPKIQLVNLPDYRENYANSVQVRTSLCDIFLLFGKLTQNSPDVLTFQSFEGIYISPQQAKLLLNLLQQNIAQYEATFGEIALGPKDAGVVQ